MGRFYHCLWGAMLIGTSLVGGLKELTSLVTVFCIAMALILLAIGPVLRMQIKKRRCC